MFRPPDLQVVLGEAASTYSMVSDGIIVSSRVPFRCLLMTSQVLMRMRSEAGA